jgi:TRAP-type C4-dicarboxylate transport system permease small subunit
MSGIAERVSAAWAVAGGLVILAIMLVTSVNVGAFALDRLARLFGANVGALPGYEDFVRLAVSCAALMFFPYCQLRRGHVAVDLFVSLFPRVVKRALDRLWLAAIVALALFLAYWMCLGMLETRADRALSPVLGWPEWPFYLPGVFSLLLWALVAAWQIFETGEHV